MKISKVLLSFIGLIGLWVILTASFVQDRSFGTNKLNAQSPEIIVLKDLSYGPFPMQKLDLCMPKSLTPGSTISSVILSHGGGGDKKNYLSICKGLARRGIVAATVNFREDPPPAYPRVVEDVKRALAWLKDLARRRNVEIHRVGAWGGSLGGYLSSMLGTNEFENKVSCVSNNFGPTDFTDPEWEGYSEGVYLFVNKFFGGITYEEDPELYENASPITHISANDAQSWLFTRSRNEKLVPRSQITRMASALEAVGIDTEIYEYTGFGPGHANRFILKAKQLLEKRMNFMENCLTR